MRAKKILIGILCYVLLIAATQSWGANIKIMTLYNFENTEARTFFQRTGFCTVPHTAVDKWLTYAKENHLKPVLYINPNRPATTYHDQWCQYYLALQSNKYHYIVSEHLEWQYEPWAKERYTYLNSLFFEPVKVYFNWANYLNIVTGEIMPSRYWPEGVERDAVTTVIFRPQDMDYTTHAFTMGREEAKEADLPLIVWLSFGVGYGDNGSEWLPRDYPLSNDQMIALLCQQANVKAVVIYPSPGDSRYPNMGEHIDAFLQEILK